MKRSERIFLLLQDYVRDLDESALSADSGLNAQQIALQLGLLRNNVSQELNHLCRAGEVIKIKSRPVRFLPKEFAEIHFTCSQDAEGWTLHPLEHPSTVVPDTFKGLIGHDSSLREPVIQAKAAILYPPHGLHTLITGQTGVGKSLFASMMFEYARSSGRLPDTAPFVVFNCADYYNNPQLLMGHLF